MSDISEINQYITQKSSSTREDKFSLYVSAYDPNGESYLLQHTTPSDFRRFSSLNHNDYFALSLLKFNQPSVLVRIHEIIVDEQTSQAFFVLSNLTQPFFRVQDTLSISEDDAKTLLFDVLSGLDTLHSNLIAHQTLSHWSFFYGDDGHTKLGDYSMCCHYPQSPPETSITHPVLSCVPPEVISVMDQEHGVVFDPFAADVWACGCAAYRCLFGKYPFDGMTEDETKHNILNHTPEQLLDGEERIGDQFRAVLKMMLQPDPKKRPTPSELLKHSLFDSFQYIVPTQFDIPSEEEQNTTFTPLRSLKHNSNWSAFETLVGLNEKISEEGSSLHPSPVTTPVSHRYKEDDDESNEDQLEVDTTKKTDEETKEALKEQLFLTEYHQANILPATPNSQEDHLHRTPSETQHASITPPPSEHNKHRSSSKQDEHQRETQSTKSEMGELSSTSSAEPVIVQKRPTSKPSFSGTASSFRSSTQSLPIPVRSSFDSFHSSFRRRQETDKEKIPFFSENWKRLNKLNQSATSQHQFFENDVEPNITLTPAIRQQVLFEQWRRESKERSREERSRSSDHRRQKRPQTGKTKFEGWKNGSYEEKFILDREERRKHIRTGDTRDFLVVSGINRTFRNTHHHTDSQQSATKKETSLTRTSSGRGRVFSTSLSSSVNLTDQTKPIPTPDSLYLTFPQSGTQNPKTEAKLKRLKRGDGRHGQQMKRHDTRHSNGSEGATGRQLRTDRSSKGEVFFQRSPVFDPLQTQTQVQTQFVQNSNNQYQFLPKLPLMSMNGRDKH
ncbi:putative Protein kinase domain containing protein [Blattamonas nauphoetae]|uniref:Protein kinase domain-containing protein n=1 Tax=Blattamonas nauphoetae TaxID=2049346 RepID=A0ABQ9XS82_9EUKA|nr:putative Protein kinase domain containing protein [Blattamonas nauphoetae]